MGQGERWRFWWILQLNGTNITVIPVVFREEMIDFVLEHANTFNGRRQSRESQRIRRARIRLISVCLMIWSMHGMHTRRQRAKHDQDIFPVGIGRLDN